MSADWSRSLGALLILAAGAAIGFAPLAPVLHALWTDPYGAFSHGYLVVGLSVWLGIQHWREAPPRSLAPWPLAALPLAALVFLVLLMEAVFINSGRLVLLPFILIAAIAFVYGRGAAQQLFWPVMYLLFALPQWWPLNGILQSLTTKVVSLLVSITDLPAYIEGNFIQVPAGMIEVASGCSGLNYVVAALALAGFYALMYLKRWRSRIVLLVAAAVMACISNWIRVYVLVAVGIFTDMQHYLIRVEHLYFGWVLFMAFMFPVLLLARRLDDADARAAAAEATTETQAQHEEPGSRVLGMARMTLVAAAVAGCILVLPAFVSIEGKGAPMQVQELPENIGPWARSGGADSTWRPVFVNAEEARARYAVGAQSIAVFRASYLRQTFDARVGRSENDFFGNGWRLAERNTTTLAGPAAHEVTESRGYLNEQERLIWSWYVIAGRPAATKLGAKLQELRAFAERRRDASAIAISTECVPDCATARARLNGFMQESGASLQ